MIRLPELRTVTTIPAFNFNDQFDLEAIVAALNSKGSPGILLVSMRAIAQSSLGFLCHVFEFYQAKAQVPLWIELDHCNDEQVIEQAVNLGVHIVMADFTHLSVDENQIRVRRLADEIRGSGCLLEAEPSPIPKHSKSEVGRLVVSPTTPSNLASFCAETKCDLVAPNLGTVHGFARTKPVIEPQVVSALIDATTVPVVAHGCDFMEPSQLKSLAVCGVRKLNFGPELRVAWSECSRGLWVEADLDEPDHREINRAAMAATQRKVGELLNTIL